MLNDGNDGDDDDGDDGGDGDGDVDVDGGGGGWLNWWCRACTYHTDIELFKSICSCICLVDTSARLPHGKDGMF